MSTNNADTDFLKTLESCDKPEAWLRLFRIATHLVDGGDKINKVDKIMQPAVRIPAEYYPPDTVVIPLTEAQEAIRQIVVYLSKYAAVGLKVKCKGSLVNSAQRRLLNANIREVWKVARGAAKSDHAATVAVARALPRKDGGRQRVRNALKEK